MGSTRFPAKVLAPIYGKPVIRRVIEACERTGIDYVLALPISDANSPLHAYARWQGWNVTLPLGHENDVLARFAMVVRENPYLTTIIRITADCPLVDHRTILELVGTHADTKGCRYLARANRPDGNDVEVFTVDFLNEALAKTPDYDRQHVCRWLSQNTTTTDAIYQEPETPCRDLKYSIDTIADLNQCERLIRTVGEAAPWQEYVKAIREGAA